MDTRLKTGRIFLILITLLVIYISSSVISLAENDELLESESTQNIKAYVKSSSTTDVNEVEIIPEITTVSDQSKNAVISPLSITSSNRTKIAEIRYSDLKAFVASNGITSIEIVTGYASTSSTSAKANAQTVIVDDNGNTMFEAKAIGGQLRFDTKMHDTSIVGEYKNTNDTRTAIDYADLRLQYMFTLPSAIDINKVDWGWTINYKKKNNEPNTIIVNGKKYRRSNSETDIANNTNTYISNVVVTNVPVSSYQYVSFSTNMYLTYEFEGIAYTFSQAESAPMKRNINGLANYYKKTIYNTLDAVTKAYIDAISVYVDDGSYTPVI